MAFTLPALPYAFDALEPHIDTTTMQIHHGKHHQAYVDNLNKAIAGTPNEGKSLEELDLSTLVQRIIQDLRHRYPDRKWIDSVEPDCSLSGDPLLLQMLVSNLAENAIKYSPREGSITIALKQERGHIQLAVKDEGAGIPDEEKKKIFNKFYRTGQEKTRSTQGTGLGLYLCRKIAQDHKAAIKVTDNSPVGSIFTVTF